jgi:hypothetical protein
MYRPSIDQDEHVTMPSIWVVEFFTPSNIDQLTAAIHRNGWDEPSYVVFEDNREALEQSRQGTAPSWWPLIALSSPNAGFTFVSNSQVRKLPGEFRSIQLYGVPIGDGVTAVVAHFLLHDVSKMVVDRELHGDHQPDLIRVPGRLTSAQDRRTITYRDTQRARSNLHNVARRWLRQHCPGIFALADESQPLMDLVLFDKSDPFDAFRGPEIRKRKERDELRAVGVSDHYSAWWESTVLPGLVLESTDTRMMPYLDGERTWSLWGNRSRAVTGSRSAQLGRGDESGLAHNVDDTMRTFLARLAFSDLLTLLKSQATAARDSARRTHGKFRKKDLEVLRKQFLTTSLDLNTIQRDVESFSKEGPYRWREPDFYQDRERWKEHQRKYAAGNSAVKPTRKKMTKLARLLKRPTPTPAKLDPVSLNDILRNSHRSGAVKLAEMDFDYRDILGTVASLGSSIDAYSVQRYAITISIASAVIAVLSLGTASVTLWLSFPEGSGILGR